jgi:hypothetical protein
LTEENVGTSALMKALARGGSLEHVFNRDGEDKQTVRRWLLDGAPTPEETVDHSESSDDEQIKIVSHEAFKFEL